MSTDQFVETLKQKKGVVTGAAGGAAGFGYVIWQLIGGYMELRDDVQYLKWRDAYFHGQRPVVEHVEHPTQ